MLSRIERSLDSPIAIVAVFGVLLIAVGGALWTLILLALAGWLLSVLAGPLVSPQWRRWTRRAPPAWLPGAALLAGGYALWGWGFILLMAAAGAVHWLWSRLDQPLPPGAHPYLD